MTITRETTSVPMNWRSQINQVVRGYETEPARGLIHGLQKDFIQNSWGHRKTKKGQGWGIEFKITENTKGTFLLVHDWGTHGMTGPNMAMTEINNLSEELHPEYRLARFSAMNYSGGNEGAGLFGRGKTLFSAASKNYHYYFETLTEDEGYRMNWKKLEGNDLQVGEKALEEGEGKSRIKESTGLDPITKTGSRIIIENPLPELIRDIKNGRFLKYIEETWWKIILKYKAEIKITFDDKIFIAEVPKTYQAAFNSPSYKKWEKGVITVSPNYHIKKIGLFLSPEKIDQDLQGVYVYRKDMKIGAIPIEEFPKKVRGRYFGFIEVDEQWEEELSEIEDLEHYGFTNKRKRSFQSLKNIVNTEHIKFMEELGIIKKEKAENKELYEELMTISSDLDQFFNQFPIKDVNDGNMKKSESLEVKCTGVKFPGESGNQVITGDKIENINFEVKNNSGALKTVQYKLKVINQNAEVLLIDKNNDNIKGDSKKAYGPYSLEIKEPLVRYEKNIIILEVNIKGSKKKVYKKEIPFYYDTSPESRSKTPIYLERLSMTLPNKKSKRVNTNEKITDIQYIVKNESPDTAFLAFNLTTHDGSDPGKRVIDTIFTEQNIILYPYEEKKISCPDIVFTKEPYESSILKGPVEIRSRLAASSNFAEFEIADIISKNPPITVFFNEEGNIVSRTFSEVQMIKSSERRSNIEGSKGNWVFYLYIDHPIYQKVFYDEEARREYIAEEMIKQMIRLHLHEGNRSILNTLNSSEGEEPKDLTDADLVNKVYLLTDQLQSQRYKESRSSIG